MLGAVTNYDRCCVNACACACGAVCNRNESNENTTEQTHESPSAAEAAAIMAASLAWRHTIALENGICNSQLTVAGRGAQVEGGRKAVVGALRQVDTLPQSSCPLPLPPPLLPAPPAEDCASGAGHGAQGFLKVGAEPSYEHCGSLTCSPLTMRGPVGGPPSRLGRMSWKKRHRNRFLV